MKILPIGFLCVLATALITTSLQQISGGSGKREIAQSALTAGSPPGPVTVGGAGNEPLIAIAPDGTLYISALQYLYRSTDGGATWTNLPGPPESQVTLASDSSLSVDPGNRVYFT